MKTLLREERSSPEATISLRHIRASVRFLACAAAMTGCVSPPAASTDLDLGVLEPALAASTPLVIHEVYGGGGNTGAPLTHDFIELLNRSSAAVSLAGLSLQYASASGPTLMGANSALITELPDVELLPGQFFLVQEAQGTAGTAGLPTPDLVDPTPIAMSASGGKVALVQGIAALGCNGGSTPCRLDAQSRILDLVGFGSATFFEGSGAAPAPGSASSVSRVASCLDRNDNAIDFSVAAPSPMPRVAPAIVCDPAADAGAQDSGADGAGNPDGGVTPQPDASTADAGPVQRTRIHEIQGRGHVSPFVGQTVRNVPGIVTAVRSNGFHFQDPEPDAEEATSDALFVFTSGAPSVRTGDSVLVDGRVNEYRPGCSPTCSVTNSAYSGLTTTQIERPSRLTIVARGQALPLATRLGATGRAIPHRTIDDDTMGPDVELGPTVFDPELDGLDFYESLEGMRVELLDAVATGATRRFGATSRELTVVADDGRSAGLRTERDGIVIAVDDFNPERIFLSNALFPDLPLVDVGTRFPGLIEGVIDYGFGNFKLLFTAPLPSAVPSALTREVTSLPRATSSELSIATFNVENLSPLDPATKFAELATLVVKNLDAPDLLALEEVQDDDGPANDGVVSARQTYNTLIAAIVAAGGPVYDFRSVDPVDGQDGGQPGGNIRVGFLFRTDRGLSFVDRGSAGSTTPNLLTSVGGVPQLAYSPGRIDPLNPAFANSRKPLAGEFRFAGQPVFVVAIHFNSKGGDQPLFGRFQPPELASAAQRVAQAGVVAEFVRSLRNIDPLARVVVLGDLNDFEFSEAVATLEAAGLTSLVTTLPANQRYSYVYEGNAQVLDHIMVSQALLPRVLGFDIVHVNAEFAEQASDHDPSLTRLVLGTAARRLLPLFECVARGEGGVLSARFGYNNPNPFRVYLPLGKDNFFLPPPSARGQRVLFEPGRHRGALEVPFASQSALVWFLHGIPALAVNHPSVRCH